MNWLQIRLLGPYFNSFSTNSYGYYSQMSQNLVSNTQIFASALIVRQAARHSLSCECFALFNASNLFGVAEVFFSVDFNATVGTDKFRVLVQLVDLLVESRRL
jgi:hypothetical protein